MSSVAFDTLLKITMCCWSACACFSLRMINWHLCKSGLILHMWRQSFSNQAFIDDLQLLLLYSVSMQRTVINQLKMFSTDSVASVKAAVPLLWCDCSLDPGIKAICPSTDTWRTRAQHGHMSSTVTSSPPSLSPGCIGCSPSVSSFFNNCIHKCVFFIFAL